MIPVMPFCSGALYRAKGIMGDYYRSIGIDISYMPRRTSKLERISVSIHLWSIEYCFQYITYKSLNTKQYHE